MNNTKVEIDKDRLHNLESSHAMLSRICGFVSNECKEGDTTLMGVVRVLAKYHDLLSDYHYNWIDTLEKEVAEEKLKKTAKWVDTK